MKVICIFNQKGGVGKTTANVNLCTALAMKGHRVLAVDIDPQGNTTSGFGVDKSKVENSIYEVLNTDMHIKESIIKLDLVDKLDLIPAIIELAGAEVELSEKENRETILTRKLKTIEDEYDFVFIDCPPSLGMLTINALTAADSVFIPIQCEFYALEGVGQLINTYSLVKKALNPQLSIEGVLLSMYDSRTKLSAEVEGEVTKHFGEKVYDTRIPRNIRLAEAPSFGLPIMLYDHKCKGSTAFEELADEFLKQQKKEA